jgi:hypothetical protein
MSPLLSHVYELGLIEAVAKPIARDRAAIADCGWSSGSRPLAIDIGRGCTTHM